MPAAGVSREEAEQLLESLVRIESYSGVERRASQHLADWLGAHGFDAEVDRSDSAYGVRTGTASGSTPGTAPAPAARIVLLGHIDTVPGDIPVRVEDGVLHGRGSVDAKGSLCTFAVAAANADLPEGVELTILGCTEEEAESSRGSRHAIGRLDPPDACIIGEPSGWDGITLGYKGRALATYELTQPWSHSAGPDASASDRAMAWWGRVLAYADAFNAPGDGKDRGVFDSLQCTVHEVQSFNNGLNDSVRMSVGFRLPADLSPEHHERELRAVLADDGACHPTLVCAGRELAHRSPRSDPIARALRASIRAHGGRPKDKVKTGTSDMNVVAPVWRCPIVAYGPGDSSLDHTPNEHQVLDEYWRAIEVLTAAIESLASELAARDTRSAQPAGGISA